MSPTIRDGRGQRSTYAIDLSGFGASSVEKRVAGDDERAGFASRRPTGGLHLAPRRPPARVARAEDLTPDQAAVVVALVNADRSEQGLPPIRVDEPVTPEDPAMPADPTPSLAPVTDPSVTLQAIKEAATAAQDAWTHLAVAQATLDLAEEAWLDCRLALAAAWHGHVGVAERRGPPEQPESDPRARATEEPTEEPADDAPQIVTRQADMLPAGGGPGAQLSRGQAKVLEAVVKHDGDRRAAAGELGMTTANVEAHLEAIGKKGLLPIDLIAKLPARFARFTGAQG